MGTNYYVIKRSKYNEGIELYNTYKTLFDEDIFNKKIKEVLDSYFIQTRNKLEQIKSDNNEIICENFEDSLKEEINTFRIRLEYYVFEYLNIIDREQVHIGKSSLGWLFLFQEQDTIKDNVRIEWHSFEDVKNWLIHNVEETKEFIIIDEYNRIIKLDSFLDLIETKQQDERNIQNKDNFADSVRNVDGYRFTSNNFS